MNLNAKPTKPIPTPKDFDTIRFCIPHSMSLADGFVVGSRIHDDHVHYMVESVSGSVHEILKDDIRRVYDAN